MTRDNHIVIRTIHARNDPEEQFGDLVLTDKELRFENGPRSIWWRVQLTAIEDVTISRKEMLLGLIVEYWIRVQTQWNEVQMFRIEGLSQDPYGFVEFIKKQHVLAQQALQPPVSPQRRRKASKGQPEPTFDLDEAIMNVIVAFRTSPMISYKKITRILGSQFKVTPDIVQSCLAELIGSQALSGYLDVQGYHRDVFFSFQCQVCDKQIRNPMGYWQCPDCERFVCTDCQPNTAYCPAHPASKTKLVQMPLRCPHCYSPIQRLGKKKKLKCPYCQKSLSV